MPQATQNHVRRAIERSGATGTAAEVLAAITAPSVEKTNSELLTLRTVAVTYGPTVAAAAAGVLKAAGQQNPLCDGIYISVCSTGINFADPLTQAMIDQIFTGEYAEVGVALKALGRWQESPLEQPPHGVRGLTTDEATVQAVLTAITDEAQAAAEAVALAATVSALRNRLRNNYNAAVVLIDAGATTWAEIEPTLTAEAE